MYSLLKSFDETIFFAINNLPHNNFGEQIFLFFSFYPLLIWSIIGVIISYFEERIDKFFMLKLMIALVLSGVLTSGIVKPLIKRPRPDLRLGEKVVVVAEKPAIFFWNNDYAFPSGHAAVAFAGASIIIMEEYWRRKKKKRNYIKVISVLLIALLTCFSRIYLGKHYPLDVIVGAFFGALSAWIAYKMVDLVDPPKVI